MKPADSNATAARTLIPIALLFWIRPIQEKLDKLSSKSSRWRLTAVVLRRCNGFILAVPLIQELKKLRHFKPVNQKLLQQLKHEQIEVDIVRVEEPENLMLRNLNWTKCGSTLVARKPVGSGTRLTAELVKF